MHELGHFGTPRWKKLFGIIPYSAYSYEGKYRAGGLIANFIMFFFVAKYSPSLVLLQYVGLVAWVHFIFYMIIGSIVPELREEDVNVRTYVFDDVPNGTWWLNIAFAIWTYFMFNDYYVPILRGVLQW